VESEENSAVSALPPVLPVEPRGPLDADVRVPGSKSITNRALLIAALADGESRLTGCLASDDTRVMCEALEALGAGIETGEREEDFWRVWGTGARLQTPAHPLDVANSGTSARFLTAACTLCLEPVVIDGSPRMRERPIGDLTRALAQLGARVEVLGEGDCPPVRVLGGGLPGGEAVVDARQSSQYVSAILLAAPYAQHDVRLRFVEGRLTSRPYVDLTLEVMRSFGAEAGWTESGTIEVRVRRPYVARDYAVEPDASSAVYPFCAAAIAGGSVRVQGVPERSLQPDFGVLALLEKMGCTVVRRGTSVELRGPERRLHSLGQVDMNAMPDAALAYAVVALFADRPTRITNVGNLRIKESDRLAALEAELRRLGARAEAGLDWIQIAPGPLHGAEIRTYDDHRMAMAFSLAGLRIPGVVIREPACVSKTWPNYFEVFGRL
jgi:3-phosphoshikimate 1-carboxyvinyltransferase